MSSDQHGLLSLPNEILLAIISYLQPTDDLAGFLQTSIFEAYARYQMNRRRSDNLRSLTQTCRRLHLSTEPLLSKERTLERGILARFTAEYPEIEKVLRPKWSRWEDKIQSRNYWGFTSLP